MRACSVHQKPTFGCRACVENRGPMRDSHQTTVQMARELVQALGDSPVTDDGWKLLDMAEALLERLKA